MKKTLILLIVFSLFSCNKNKQPEYVIPFDDMVDIIVEIHITDGLLASNKVRRSLVKMDTTNYYDALLNNYNYKRHDFDTSLYYYSKNIDQYDLIYDEVLNQLSKIESELKENRNRQDVKKE
ncbi:MAG: DUF4296 domain-containing protein [Bacteroidales bacterium]|nr:DUF4296 domain-containing protein [Bacteroidales bacterium]